ncbi:MAG TPA: cytochrome P450 [Candidatus Binatia bacterium]|nr:cytochrome P450 [Candidatus Binatia bacterium]
MDDARAAESEIRFAPQDLFDFPDPYPLFAALRQSSPVHRVVQFHRESYLVTRYDDVAAILRDNETFSSRANAELAQVMGRTIIEMDAKEHQKHRSIVQYAFHFKSIAPLESWMRQTCDQLIDRFASAGTADLVQQFTEPFPIRVIARIAGVPIDDFDLFKRYALDIIGFSKDRDRGLAASLAIRDFLLPLIAERRAHPQDDVLSRLCTGEVDGQRLNDEEIVSFMRLLLPAGAETTFRLIGSTLFALLHDPGALAEVVADRSLLHAALEETLRWETPVLFVGRETTRPVTVAGVEIPAGKAVTPVIGSANRDETHFPDPDRWDLHRGADDHLSFGGGRHFCLGYHLAKLEARIALEALFDRVTDLRPDPERPSQIRGLAFRSPTSLHASFSAR